MAKLRRRFPWLRIAALGSGAFLGKPFLIEITLFFLEGGLAGARYGRSK